MLYYFVIPIYLALLVGLIAAAVAMRFIKPLRWTSGYIAGGTIGTLPGFILCNAVIWLLAIGLAYAATNLGLPQWVSSGMALTAIVMLLSAPIVGSAAGVAVGFVSGMAVVFLWRRRGLTKFTTDSALID